MKLHAICLFITFLALHEILTDVLASSSLSTDPFRGISPEDEKYYKSDVIRCKDGSGKFTRGQLNDDYCDCIDGTDEPGTSACPSGKFYCKNIGHTPLRLFSSRVSDGICDCCDGSDEYNGIVKCRNMCWEAGKVARDKLKKKITTYQEGVTIRKNEVEQAKLAIAKDEEELSRLKREEKVLKGIVEQLKERKEEIEKAEEKERLQKEKEEKERKEAEEKANGDKAKTEGEVESDKKEETPAETKDEDKEIMDHEKIGELEESPSDEDETKDHDDVPNVAEELLDNVGEQHDKPILFTQKEEAATASETAHEAGREVPSGEIKTEGNGVSENTEGLSKEELGRLIASRWTGEKAEKEENKEGSTESYDHNDDPKDTPNDAHDEEYDAYVSETDDDIDDKKYEYDDPDDEAPSDFPDEEYHDHSSPEPESNDDLDLSDISTDSNPSWLEKIQKTVRNLLKAVNLIKTPVDKSDADQVRKEYESSSSKLSKIQSRISKLSEKQKLDFGPEKEFYSFYGRCFESKQNKYTYKVCPFKDATQEEGYSKTRLGSWEKFDDSNRVMIFANGEKCWNGPDRSMKVKLRCGLTNEVTDVDEPSRCEYVALLSTPALCLEDKLKELEKKLELMNKQPAGHDEL